MERLTLAVSPDVGWWASTSGTFPGSAPSSQQPDLSPRHPVGEAENVLWDSRNDGCSRRKGTVGTDCWGNNSERNFCFGLI